MADKIGPTFFDEMKAAGLTVFPSWSSGGIHDCSQLDADQIIAVANVLKAHDPSKQIPPNASLATWLTALDLWKRGDSTAAAQIEKRVADIIGAGNPIGFLAKRYLASASEVSRDELRRLAGVFDFAAADVDESLWRASRVAAGDLSGVWPLVSEDNQTGMGNGHGDVSIEDGASVSQGVRGEADAGGAV